MDAGSEGDRADGYPVTAYKFIQANLGTWTVMEMAALFGVSANAYYRWAKHGVSLRRRDDDARLLELIRLMRENGLNARRGWCRPRTTDSGHGLGACENVLNRDFLAEGPGQKWVSDITYLRILGGWLYLTVQTVSKV